MSRRAQDDAELRAPSSASRDSSAHRCDVKGVVLRDKDELVAADFEGAGRYGTRMSSSPRTSKALALRDEDEIVAANLEDAGRPRELAIGADRRGAARSVVELGASESGAEGG